MIACQWHRDVPYGKQAAAAIMRAWGRDKCWKVFRVLES
jgi:hypothetical protein